MLRLVRMLSECFLCFALGLILESSWREGSSRISLGYCHKLLINKSKFIRISTLCSLFLMHDLTDLLVMLSLNSLNNRPNCLNLGIGQFRQLLL